MFYVEVKGQPQVLVLSVHLAADNLLAATHCVGQTGHPLEHPRFLPSPLPVEILTVPWDYRH